MHYISKNNFVKLLEALQADYEVYVPVKKDKQRFYKKFNQSSDNVVIGEVRAYEPLKAFFSRAREIVAEDFKTDKVPSSTNKPFAIVGVKACDLKGFKVQDHVFTNHDYKDPFYIRNRQQNLIISADCTSAIETCFCMALGIQPYPRENFDINLSQGKEGFLVEVGSQKGETLIDKHSSLFEEMPDEALSERDGQRNWVAKKVEDNIKENDIPHQESYKGIIEKKYESDIWKDEAKTCVECGACNTICPTCHCFLLYDQKSPQHMARLRIWDSCMIKDFAEVAGGANPRPKLWMRLRNRFEKKFDFFPKVADIYACTGCGRCISACPAKIDIRKVLKKLVGNAQ
ncbi:MAG: 4Fe-4S dicluster domain-containing protein [Candidatus Omnitrophota bacterium]|nr:MAG: 4Fe-4S dicluster domain-containing protein [Candidatus Omnitrophota bacterium]